LIFEAITNCLCYRADAIEHGDERAVFVIAYVIVQNLKQGNQKRLTLFWNYLNKR
jgi:hypothetical protein